MAQGLNKTISKWSMVVREIIIQQLYVYVAIIGLILHFWYLEKDSLCILCHYSLQHDRQVNSQHKSFQPCIGMSDPMTILLVIA